MKKIFGMLIILVLIYLGIQVAFRFFGNGHEVEYQVMTNDVNFKVNEKFTNNTKNELNSYYFEISNNGNTFYYQTLTDFSKKDHIIENIYSYKDDNYNCILPVFEGNKIITDIMCLSGNIIYSYHDIAKNSSLEQFAKSLETYGYNPSNWVDNKEPKSHENITIYQNNIIKNHHIGLANYKGVYVINGEVGNIVENVELFKSDVYKRPLSMIYENYYISVNYNEQYRFTKIFLVDLTNDKTKEINCDAEISFDSYIQGTYDNSVYVFDRNSKKQYEINLKTAKVLEVGNENSGIIIYNGDEQTRISAGEAKNKEVLFVVKTNDELNASGYTKIDSNGGKETGYYYLYQKDGNKYNVYRTNVKNTNQITYVFSTTDLNRVVYSGEYIYFLDGNTIKYYSNSTGVKSIIENNELSFNDSLIFGIYNK